MILKVINVLIMLSISARVFPWEGITVHGHSKYKEGFHAVDYVNPMAPKGGKFVIGQNGTFDTLNPFTVKGVSPTPLTDLVFQQLGQRSYDEPFSMYPEIAESFDIAADELSMVIRLKKNLKFSDGQDLDAEDVKFSFDLFKSNKVNAFYNSYWGDILEVNVIDPYTVEINFANKNTELAAIATQIIVLPSHIYGKRDFTKDFSGIAIGSGPYMVKDFKRGSYIHYIKNPYFNPDDDAFYRGRFNFEEIVVKFYKDETAMIEGFKKGEFDLYECYSSSAWSRELTGPKFETLNLIKKVKWRHHNNEGGQAFFFNMKNDLLADRVVRQAIAIVFDFSWANKTLFYNQYKVGTSFYENSEFRAEALPKGEELKFIEKLQEKFPSEVPPEITSVSTDYLIKLGSQRMRLKLARKKLKENGYGFNSSKTMVRLRDQKPLQFDFLLTSKTMQRIIEPYAKQLKKIGIGFNIIMEESSVYSNKVQNREYDLVVLGLRQSQSPGNEQISMWHSSQANKEYSRNYSGLSNNAVDYTVDKIVHAHDRDKLVVYTKVLDRLLFHLRIGVPNWYIDYHRVALWNKFSWPSTFPSFYEPSDLIQFMWMDKIKLSNMQRTLENM